MEEDNKIITIGVREGSYILTPEQMATPIGDFLNNRATKRKTLLWLDDQRNPFLNEEGKVPKVAIERRYEIVWVLNYSQFTKYINENGIPDMVSFDHDLVEEHYTPEYFWDNFEESVKFQNWRYKTYKEKTGLDCARWLVERCKFTDRDLPIVNVHSANPVGKMFIEDFLNFVKLSKLNYNE